MGYNGLFRLGYLSIFGGDHGNVFPATLLGFKFYVAVYQAEQSEISAHSDIIAGVKLGTFLAHDDVSGDYDFGAVLFDAAVFRAAIPAVTTASTSFLMCHVFLSYA